MKTQKLIFMCPYYYKCNMARGSVPVPFYSNNASYYERGIKCKHPFLTYRGEVLCMLAYYENDFDYDETVKRIHVHWKVKARRLLSFFKRRKHE